MAIFAAEASLADEPSFIGLEIQGTDRVISDALGLSGPGGVLVRDVAIGSPAAIAGFERGDLITTFNGVPVTGVEELTAKTQILKAGETITADVRRGAKSVALTMQVGVLPQGWRDRPGAYSVLGKGALTMASLTDKLRDRFGLRWGTTGVLVTLIEPEKLSGTDLQQGEVIVQVNQADVWMPEQVIEAYQMAKKDQRKHLLLLVHGIKGFRYSLLPVQ